MALVASRLAAEQLIAQFFLLRKFVFSCLHVVVLRREGTHLWRELVCGNRQPEPVINAIGASAACRTQVDRGLIILRWRPWSRANSFRIRRPMMVNESAPHRVSK